MYNKKIVIILIISLVLQGDVLAFSDNIINKNNYDTSDSYEQLSTEQSSTEANNELITEEETSIVEEENSFVKDLDLIDNESEEEESNLVIDPKIADEKQEEVENNEELEIDLENISEASLSEIEKMVIDIISHKTIATESETTQEDNKLEIVPVSTTSEIVIEESEFLFDDEMIVATISDTSLLNDDMLLSSNGDAHIKNNIVYDKTLLITEDTIINISTSSVILATNSCGILVKDATLTINGEGDSLIEGSDCFTVIQAENATINLNNIKIKAGKEANAIEVIDTVININGCEIYGGDGKSNFDKVGNDGKAGIIANQNKNKKIVFTDSYLKAGDGGSGYSKDTTADAGFGLMYNNVIYMPDEEKGPFDGYAGSVGGGNGGYGLIINSSYEDLLEINNSKIYGGNGGNGLLNISNEELLLSVTELNDPSETSYSLRDLGCTTSVKDQGATFGCWAFSLNSAAETGIIKNDREYAKTLVEDADVTKLDFSELHTMNYYFNHPDDPLGIAGKSSVVYNQAMDPSDDQELFYLNRGAALVPVALFVTQGRTIAKDEYYLNSDKVTNKETLFNDVKNLHDKLQELVKDDEHKYDIPIKVTEAVIISRTNFTSGTAGDIAYHKSLRKYIKEYGAVQMAMSMDGLSQTDDINDNHDSTMWSSKRNTGSGHAVHVVGWDDNFPKENFSQSNGNIPATNGALLIKNSYGSSDSDSGYFWLSYEHAVASSFNVVAYKFEKKLNTENIYFCDSGLSDEAYDYNAANPSQSKAIAPKSSYGNKYLIKKDCEKLNAVSIYQTVRTNSYKGFLSIYKLNTSSPNNTKTLLYQKEVIVTPGNNYYNLEKEIYVSKNDYIFACIEEIENLNNPLAGILLPISIPKSSTTINYNTEYTKSTSYLKVPNKNWGHFDSDSTRPWNFRVRLITKTMNNKYNVSLNKISPPSYATGVAVGNSLTTNQVLLSKKTKLENNSISLDGWSITGWSYNENGTTKDFDNNKEYNAVELKVSTESETSTVNLYSYWEPNKYNINFDVKDYMNEKVDKVVARYDNDITLASISNEKVIGCDFKGWMYNGKMYSSGETLIKPNFATKSNANIYMVATVSNYSFNINFVKTPPEKVNKQITGEVGAGINDIEYRTDYVTIPNNNLTCQGYVFKGWSTTPNGDVVVGANERISSKDLLSKFNLTSENFTNGQTFNLYSKFVKPYLGSRGAGSGAGGSMAALNEIPSSSIQVNMFDGPATVGNLPLVSNGHMEKNIDGSLSYITENGEKLVGWSKIEVDDKADYYFFTDEGTMWTGWIKDNAGKIYMLGLDGKMMSGEYETTVGTYKFDLSGEFLGTKEDIIKTGLPVLETYRGEWSTLSGDLTSAVYVLKNGNNEIKNVFKNGFYEINDKGIDKIYYFDKSGVAKVGLQLIDGKLYYFEIGGENLGVLTYEVNMERKGLKLTEAKDLNITTTPYRMIGFDDYRIPEVVKQEETKKEEKKDKVKETKQQETKKTETTKAETTKADTTKVEIIEEEIIEEDDEYISEEVAEKEKEKVDRDDDKDEDYEDE